MINLPLKTLAEILGSSPDGLSDASFQGVTIDSRQSCEGKLFVAIRGANFDGHNFVDMAYQNGASVALVEERQQSGIEQIEVADCKQAMGRLANYWRHCCNPCVIALTGSNGKTTVKEMLFQILARQATSLATHGNLNNDIGVPLTLFRLEQRHDFAIIEMGANHRGEIAQLAQIAEPDIVYVNNVAAARALFNADEVASKYWHGLCAAETQINCGLDNAADVTATWSATTEALQVEFHYQGKSRGCELGVIGVHNVRNALAAVSLAILAGIDFDVAVDNMAGFSGVKGRLQILPGPADSRLIDDSYNANPDSLEAGIEVLCSLPGSAWLALGDMGELGAETEALHRKAARAAAAHGVEKFFAIGEMSCIASAEFGDEGYCFEDIGELAKSILEQIHEGVNLLVKGSRAAGMERLIAILVQSANGGDANAV
jgi:UDP-N-acetylmuramoyl-tripeptide--D-alanyl-D-alanine ligase